MSLDTDNYDTLDQDDVDNLIEQIGDDAETRYIVFRVRNGDEIESFDSEAAAESYIDDQDYDTSRVQVMERGDQEALDDLESLRTFRNEARSDCGDFRVGSTLYRADTINGDFARERAEEGDSSLDFDTWPFSVIDWDAAANELLVLARANSTYATLKGARYYLINV